MKGWKSLIQCIQRDGIKIAANINCVTQLFLNSQIPQKPPSMKVLLCLA